MIEVEDEVFALALHGFENRAGVLNLLTIDECPCLECEPSADSLLVGGMNILRFSQINRHHHGGVWHRTGAVRLDFAGLGHEAVESWQLDEKEWQS